jgi:hypothetical protein
VDERLKLLVLTWVNMGSLDHPMITHTLEKRADKEISLNPCVIKRKIMYNSQLVDRTKNIAKYKIDR